MNKRKPIATPEPHITKEEKPKTAFFRSPRLHSWLLMGADLCTTLGYDREERSQAAAHGR